MKKTKNKKQKMTTGKVVREWAIEKEGLKALILESQAGFEPIGSEPNLPILEDLSSYEDLPLLIWVEKWLYPDGKCRYWVGRECISSGEGGDLDYHLSTIEL